MMDSQSEIQNRVTRRGESDFDSDPAALWLCQLPGMNSALMLRLLAARGTADAIVRTPSAALRELGVPPGLIARIVGGPREVPRVAAGLKGLQRLGILPLPLAAQEYPQRLRALAQPPLAVYVQGSWPITRPLLLIVAPDEIDPRVMAAWAEIVRLITPHVALATARADLPGDPHRPALLGLPYGLMLARQRLPGAMWQHVAAGSTTLITTAPPTAQPDPATISALLAALAALADAIVLLKSAVAEDEPLIATARQVGVPVFVAGAAPTKDAPVPAGVRRLRNGKAGARLLLPTLGIHDAGTEVAQQERLF